MKGIASLAVLYFVAAIGSGLQDGDPNEDAPRAESSFRHCPEALLDVVSNWRGLPEDDLFDDKRAVCAAFARLENDFEQEGLTARDAMVVTEISWRKLRAVTPLKDAVEFGDVYAAAMAHGRLIVNSNPDGASVTVNGDPCDSTTECIEWVPAGTYSITLSKDGYLSEHGTATVKSQSTVVFHRDLARVEQ